MEPQHIGQAIVGGLVLVKMASDFFRGRNRDRRQHGTSEILGRIEGKLDTSIERITAVEHVVWGVDRGNGLRGVTTDHEERLRDLERTQRSLGPSDVGSLAPRRL